MKNILSILKTIHTDTYPHSTAPLSLKRREESRQTAIDLLSVLYKSLIHQEEQLDWFDRTLDLKGFLIDEITKTIKTNRCCSSSGLYDLFNTHIYDYELQQQTEQAK